MSDYTFSITKAGLLSTASAFCLTAMMESPVASGALPATHLEGLAGGISINNIQVNTLVAPVTTVPIGGYQPLVAVSMTNEDTTDDLDFFGYSTVSYLNNDFGGIGGTSSSAHALSSNGTPHYQVALYDTGAQVHLLTANAISNFDFAGNNLLGTTQFAVGGVGGSELVTIHDPTGIYVTGFDNATGGASLSLNTNTLVGQYNVTVVGAEDPNSILPDVVGLPLASQFTTVIRTDQRKEIVVGADTFESPNIELLPFGDLSIPNYTLQAPLSLLPGAAFASPPAFFPGFENLEDFHDNPSIPSNTPGALFLTGDISSDGTDLNNLDMFLDTGAQVTVVSELTAANLGFDVVLDEPEFTVEVQGAGGTLVDVPGFFVDSFSLDTVGGDFTLTNVPVLVLDVLDPRDGVNPVPAIVGTNLFGDRNIVISPEPGNAFLSISDIVTVVGDLNSDGFVGIDDLNIVLSHWNQDVTEGYLFSGDPTGDGFVGIDDLNVVLSNWNNGTPPPPGALAAIPEPASVLLLASGMVLLGRRRA